ncbi:MAG: hypothetical protein KGL39_11870 [Patescibacteria group bacterium]|nr:hypothetical protein [Patescibacteria group bacterium]
MSTHAWSDVHISATSDHQLPPGYRLPHGRPCYRLSPKGIEAIQQINREQAERDEQRRVIAWELVIPVVVALFFIGIICWLSVR